MAPVACMDPWHTPHTKMLWASPRSLLQMGQGVSGSLMSQLYFVFERESQREGCAFADRREDVDLTAVLAD